MLSPSDSSFITEIIHASAFSSTFSHKHIEASSGATTNLCLGGKKKRRKHKWPCNRHCQSPALEGSSNSQNVCIANGTLSVFI